MFIKAKAKAKAKEYSPSLLFRNSGESSRKMSVYLKKFSNYKTQINLMGGEVFFGDKPALVWTVLGSCLAIVFHVRRLQHGAIAHAQLPEQKKFGTPCSMSCPVQCNTGAGDENIYKYVSCSFHRMIEKYRQMGIKKGEIAVKIFGGANVIRHSTDVVTVGEQNVDVALKLIKEGGLNLVSRDTGGNIGRTIYFCTDTGAVFLRRHKPTLNTGIDRYFDEKKVASENFGPSGFEA